MKSSLEEALYALFGEKAPANTETPSESVKPQSEDKAEENLDYVGVAKKVIDEFRRTKQASAEGNWNAFGESMTALEQSINQLEKSIEE